MSSNNKSSKKATKGKVVSSKAKNTIIVLVERRQEDSKYKKIIKTSKRFMVHVPDDMTMPSEGEIVLIESHRPISKNKSFILKSIS